jgi:SDR family mycofactocin-dependent oxidoreductase
MTSRRLEGKVALVTGAARGQGKSHCVRLAQEGANIIAVDIAGQIATVDYPLGSPEDLADTVDRVEALDQRIVSAKADVRERHELRAAVAAGLEMFGRLDIVCANAGILPLKRPFEPQQFVDAMDVDFGGVMNTVGVSLPHLREGASIIITGSVAGLVPGSVNNPALGPGGAGYGLAKTMIVKYTETLARQLATSFIRVNAIHPTNCNTNLMHNDEMYHVFRPDIPNPTREDVLPAFTNYQAMPIPYIEPGDISNVVAFLASDEARYITGINLRVDGGALVKAPGGLQG